ncbi:MAG: hypothetical protein EF812_03390 [Methanosarcinales archaeon]|nr:MAG: hypothetical protein EF812_03390 [Methanosarcinales archaeon]
MEQPGDRLDEIKLLVDWGAFRPIMGDTYDNRSEQGGRPDIDEVVMTGLSVLRQVVQAYRSGTRGHVLARGRSVFRGPKVVRVL